MANTVIQQKDTTFTKIFVGGLPYHTTDKSLREFFDKFGDIEEAVVITDRQTGKSRGYGFVTMANREAAERACKDPNPIIDGRKANVNLAYLGAKPRGIQAAIPFTIKSNLPGIMPGQYGLPQYIYPPTAYVAAATSPQSVLATVPHSPLSPTAATTAGQFLDYTTAASAYASQFANSAAAYEAYPATANGFVTPGAAYTYALQQPALTAATPTIHYQAQQIQERMQ